jgi:hypothetical protein
MAFQLTKRAGTVTDDPRHLERLEKVRKRVPWVEKMHPPFASCFIGTPGSYKTSTLMSIIEQTHQLYDKIVFISGSADSEDDLNSLSIPKSKIEFILGTYFNNAVLNIYLDLVQDYQSKRREEGKPTKSFLLILDDMIGHSDITKKNSSTALTNLYANYRHLGISVIVVSQHYRALPILIRNSCCSHLLVFGVSERELEKIAEENANEYFTDEDIIEIYKTIKKSGVIPSFMAIINRGVHPSERIQFNFEKIEIEE